jgi:hypothetical protein
LVVIFVSEGKQSPLLNKSSETPLTYACYWANTGCRCMGFHKGRD